MWFQVQWLKGEEPLRATDPRKYVTIGNGTELRIRHVDYTDTGVYFCQAKSSVGTTRDMSTVIVMRQDAQCESTWREELRGSIIRDYDKTAQRP